MAYIETTVDDGSYYNVNFSVGANSTNKRDDVYLVQWMLHRVYNNHPLLAPPEKKRLKIDGWIGAQTIKWIKAFQSDMRRVGRECAFDGRMDSARKAFGAASNKPYTILWLNTVLLAANPKAYSDPASDPEAPLELLMALATNTAAAGPYEEQPIQAPASGGI